MSQQAVVTDYFTRKRQLGSNQPSKRRKLLHLSEEVTGTATKVTNKEFSGKSQDLVTAVVPVSRSLSKSKAETTVLASTHLTRSTRKKQGKHSIIDYFSPIATKTEPVPSQDDFDVNSYQKDESFVTTTATDNHDLPASPSKRSHRQNEDFADSHVSMKRGRITPKKCTSYNFEKSLTLEPQINFQENSMSKPKKTAQKSFLVQPVNERKGQQAQNDPLPVTNIDSRIPDQTVINKHSADNALPCQYEVDYSQATTSENNPQPIPRKQISLDKAKALADSLLTKKTRLGDVRTALKSKGKLKDLQDTLLKMKDLKKREVEAKSKKTGSKDLASKEKTSTTPREHAYARFHTLAQEIPKGLPLPYKYKILYEIFKSADTIVSMFFNRQETSTWTKVQQAVRDMIKKKFDQVDLGRIKHLFPTAYKFRQEKGVPTFSDLVKRRDYQLTIEPILPENEVVQTEEAPKLTSAMLVQRRHQFHLQILDVVKEHHQNFLAGMDPPLVVKNDELRRWHPQFPLDKVPDIPCADLPTPPDQDEKRCSSAKDVLEKARGHLTKKAVEALRKVADKCTPEKCSEKCDDKKENNNDIPTKTSSKTSVMMNGISQALLVKICEKEAQQKLKNMIRSDADQKKVEKLKLLPDVAKCLRTLFIAEKKGSLPMDFVASKLAKSCPFVATPVLVDEHLRLLAELTTPWFSLITVRNQEYARLNKNTQIAEVVNQLRSELKEAEKA